MSILHIALATSGLPGASKSVWCPRMCAALVDDAGTVTDSFAVSIRADGRHIEAAATRRHGNVQCAHFQCNVRKQARPMGQLRLFG